MAASPGLMITEAESATTKSNSNDDPSLIRHRHGEEQ
jgi:hypothetical protein